MPSSGHVSHLTCPDRGRMPNGFSVLQVRDWFIIGTQIDGGTGNSPWALPERENAGWIWLSAATWLLILSFRTTDQPGTTKTSLNRTQNTLARSKRVFRLNLSHTTAVNYTTLRCSTPPRCQISRRRQPLVALRRTFQALSFEAKVKNNEKPGGFQLQCPCYWLVSSARGGFTCANNASNHTDLIGLQQKQSKVGTVINRRLPTNKLVEPAHWSTGDSSQMEFFNYDIPRHIELMIYLITALPVLIARGVTLPRRPRLIEVPVLPLISY